MDRLTLSDGNIYEVVGTAKKDGKEYFHLINTNLDGSMLFCYLDNEEMVEADKDVARELLPQFYESAVNVLKNKEVLEYLKELLEEQSKGSDEG